MLKLLIAVRSGVFADSLAQTLSSQFEIHNCSTGASTQQLIEAVRPDVLVIDLRLNDQDGRIVLDHCRFRPPVILALTDLVNEEIMHWAADAAIDALIIIPCSTKYVTEYIECIAEKAPSPEA